MPKTSTFAHLIGLATMASRSRSAKGSKPGKGARADADDLGDQQNAKGSAQDDDDDSAAEDDEDDSKAKGRKAKGKAKGDTGDEDAEDDAEDDAEEDDDSKAKGRKAKGSADDDADAEDEDDDTTKAVRADRQRCARIIAHGLAHGCVEQAGVLAFDSDLRASAAINVLKAGGSHAKGSAQGLAQRMSALNVKQVGPGGSSDLPAGMTSIAAGIIKAGQ